MKAFAQLIYTLGITTKTNEKLAALTAYFNVAGDPDKIWTIAMFSGRKPRRFVTGTQLRIWAAEVTGLPQWLMDECYLTVGDLSETIALLLPDTAASAAEAAEHSLTWYLQQFITLDKQDEAIRKQFVLACWNALNAAERFAFNKLISGNFRIGVSQQLMINALAKVTNQPASVVAHRLSGNWDPSSITFQELMTGETENIDASKPYPFYLAYGLEDVPESLGDPAEWQAEWKWDGIRGQIIKRNNELFIWSRGEELMTGRLPELGVLKELLPDGVCIDGEILPLRENNVLPFAVLQTRIGRKNVSKKQLQEAPVGFYAYDLLEYNYEDWRSKPLTERRAQLEAVVQQLSLQYPVAASPHNNPNEAEPQALLASIPQRLYLSPVVHFESWEALTETRHSSRDFVAEGIMLKRKNSAYQVGRKRGDWWKWKIDPLTIDAVMVYAQKGTGRRSNLYTDYTFAVKDGEKLVTFTKAYSGLTDKEFNEVDNFVKRNSLEKFGPVRTVKPELVFEIAFEGIAASNRHKSGVALRFPRISRWRKDKKADEINTIEDLKGMLEVYGK